MRVLEDGRRRRRACHELRGALQALGLGLELSARTGVLPPARARALELELGRARLALADLTGGPGEPARSPVELAPLLADSVEAWRPAAAPRELTLELRGCADARVWGDRSRLAQATGNLIANAIEHGSGTVSVSARVLAGTVRIEVCDEGPGLTMPLREVIGRRRHWLAWPRAGGARGHGVAIVAAVARSHGGSLELAPSGAGARLVLELPLAERALIAAG